MKQSVVGKVLRSILARRGSIVAPLSPGWQREREFIADTRSKTRLLLTDPAALHILVCARAARSIPGVFAEAGVFKGGSARLICEEKGEAPLHLFDVFETQQISADDEGEAVRTHFGKIHGAESEVRRLLAGYPGLHFHAGVFPGTACGLEHLRFSFVHIDLDLPDAMAAALDYFHPRLVPGGILVADDYSDPGVRDRIDFWLSAEHDTIIEMPWSQLMIVRQAQAGLASDSQRRPHRRVEYAIDLESARFGQI
ncbi:MAG TPA: TylF/MycF/NovP-related O-methyltransferase [Sphingomicrobium sp.]|nr:TylF/MycF/NovP-related O-methyltransferase [Sphingomicrobium sp.]